MSRFRIPETDEELWWPGGSCRVAALLALSPAELERRVGARLQEGDEPGLGPWRGVGLFLASGWPVELICYEREQARGPLVQLRADVTDDPAAARRETAAALGLAPRHIAWVPPAEAGP